MMSNPKTLETKLKLKGQEALIVGQMVKSLYGAKASNEDRQAIEGAYSKKFFDNTLTAELKTKNLLDFVRTAYIRSGESLVKRGATYTPVNEMNSITKRINSSNPTNTKTIKANGTAKDYANKTPGVIFKNKHGGYFHFVNGEPIEYKGN